MRVILVSTDRDENSPAAEMLGSMKTVFDADGIKAEVRLPGAGGIHACTGCGKCRKAGRCFFEDGGINEIISEADLIDGFVFAGTSFFGAPDRQLCGFMDRLFRCAPGKFDGKPSVLIIGRRNREQSVRAERVTVHLAEAGMPYVSVFPYINKDGDIQEQKDTAEMLIRMMRQDDEERRQGTCRLNAGQSSNFFSR
ncbi:MAG: hypothetical protein K6D03_09835 [Solobacterium sp.]|nr:hypothetical protein [Solobacterium sp.]